MGIAIFLFLMQKKVRYLHQFYHLEQNKLRDKFYLVDKYWKGRECFILFIYPNFILWGDAPKMANQ